MRAPGRLFRLVAGTSLGVVAIAGPARAQTPQPVATVSLTELTAEIRLLRAAIEEGSRRQSETQAISIYLSAQQSRMVQLSNRLDDVRGELADATAVFQQVQQRASSSQEALERPLRAEERREIEAALPHVKAEVSQAAAAVQQLRSRESELVQALQTEDVRWNDLIGRLEQMIRR